tara:strand:- start:50 stop:385 length:336 start_codon:yes stop_codon:yes gene_type:complete
LKKGVDSMTEPMDTQEMLAEYGTFKSSQLEVLDILIDTLKLEKSVYKVAKVDLESIVKIPQNAKWFIKWEFLTRKLTKWHIPHTKEDALPFIDSMINNIDECINELVEERR